MIISLLSWAVLLWAAYHALGATILTVRYELDGAARCALVGALWALIAIALQLHGG
jgi:hypothetical protein